jgi:hypothetical protein
MSATTAHFLGSGRRVWATVAPPTTVNRACYLVSELAPIADTGADDHGICNGPIAEIKIAQSRAQARGLASMQGVLISATTL